MYELIHCLSVILPVGCDWAKHATWRIKLNCPSNQFIVPSRLQASTNISEFCHAQAALFQQTDRFSFQTKNTFEYKKQVRQLSSKFFGDGFLDRHDNPYFPIYYDDTPNSNYWSCVGTNPGVEGCSFLVNASQYFGAPAHLGGDTIATLILPGPYCSTLDMYEHTDRVGGEVYKTFFTNHTEGNVRMERHKFSLLQNSEISNDESTWPNNNLKQSDNVYFVIRGKKKSDRFGEMRIDRCFITMTVRDATLAGNLWRSNRYKI